MKYIKEFENSTFNTIDELETYVIEHAKGSKLYTLMKVLGKTESTVTLKTLYYQINKQPEKIDGAEYIYDLSEVREYIIFTSDDIEECFNFLKKVRTFKRFSLSLIEESNENGLKYGSGDYVYVDVDSIIDANKDYSSLTGSIPLKFIPKPYCWIKYSNSKADGRSWDYCAIFFNKITNKEHDIYINEDQIERKLTSGEIKKYLADFTIKRYSL